MGAQTVQPHTLEEHIVFRAIIGTWLLWLLGALYLTGPVIGAVLILLVLGRFFGIVQDGVRLPPIIPVGVILWCVGTLAMLMALVLGHLDFELGIAKTIKSSIGWGKGWALLAIFPLAGAMLSIRPLVLYRATGILARQTLVLAPFFLLAGNIGLPMYLYTSPLSMIGGPGSEFFDVTLYAIDATNGALRWRFFGPWATATAFLASIWLIFALYERSQYWKYIGIASAIVVCWMAGSRSSIVGIPLIISGVLIISNLHRPKVLLALAFATVAVVLMLDFVISTLEETKEAFTAARAASSRVRDTLNNIGYHRWYSEAFWFGHGVVERGPHLVEFMPIGSHHTWYGLLFVKGAVGFVALAVPLAWSIGELALKAQADRVARCALATILAVAIFSFADNLEIVTYLIWPGLLLLGIGLRRRYCNPYVMRLGAARRWRFSPEAPLGNGGLQPAV